MKRCNVCGFERDASYFTTRQLPGGKRWRLCQQCAETQDMRTAAERERAAFQRVWDEAVTNNPNMR